MRAPDVLRHTCRRWWAAGAAIVVGAAAFGGGGCAADRALNVRVDADVHRPARCAVLLFVDGFGRASFDRARAAGEIPNIERHLLARGVSVDAAVAALPSITYSNAVTFLTGRYPGHHGIVANRWFDPIEGRARDYTLIKTYQRVDSDYFATTIHDLLTDEDSTSFQAAQRRGADYAIDNWATSGINWFFGNHSGVDCLVAQDLEVIAEQHVRPRKRWPAFIFAYFPGVDHAGHEHGTRSEAYRRAVRNLDAQIGRFCEGLRQARVYDSTLLVLASDHGMVEVGHDRALDIPASLRANSGRPVATAVEVAADPRRALAVDAICAVTASRWAAIYFRSSATWSDRPVTGWGNAAWLQSWLTGSGGSLLDHEAIELAAGRAGPNAAWLRSRRGVSIVEREGAGRDRRYRYRAVRGDALGLMDDATLRECVGASAMPDRAWLERSAASRYPDLVPQIVEMFDSPRAGDIVLFASAGWDFSAEDPAAGHGSVLADEMLVPMVFAGPGIGREATIRVARNCDVMPTIADWLGVLERHPAPASLDGISHLPALRPAGQVSRR